MPDADQISYQLATKLAPPGLLATRIGKSLRKLWLGVADELARVYGRAVDLINEAHPATCNELLDDWEAEFGLPDPCVTATLTDDDRRAAIASRLSATGGSSIQYFTNLAANFGVAITITEGSAFLIGRNGMGDGIGGDEYAYQWYVTAPASTPIAAQQLMECVFARIKPAHTDVVFYYV